MTTIMNLHLAGVVAGMMATLIGLVLCSLARKHIGAGLGRKLGLLGAILVVFVGSLATIGGATHFVGWHIAAAKLKPRGVLVDVGGFKMHILCEGEVRDLPPVVWLAGGRGTGLFLYHLHKRMRQVTRSCLYDRSATGWSEVHPNAPLRIRTDAEDLAKLLRASGEAKNGPFVLIGHSAGGIEAANFAKLFPELTAGAVLLDPSAPLHDFVGAVTWCKYMATGNLVTAWLTSLGYNELIPLKARYPAEIFELYKDLSDVLPDIVFMEDRPVNAWLSLKGAYCRDPLGAVFAPGALGDLPLKLIVQPARSIAELKADPVNYPWEMSDFEWENWRAIVQMTAHQYEAMSSRVIYLQTPPGTTHNFPYEAPEFVFEESLDMLNQLRRGRDAFSVSGEGADSESESR